MIRENTYVWKKVTVYIYIVSIRSHLRYITFCRANKNWRQKHQQEKNKNPSPSPLPLKPWIDSFTPTNKKYLENLMYHFFRQLWLVLWEKLMEISSNFFSRYIQIHPGNAIRKFHPPVFPKTLPEKPRNHQAMVILSFTKIAKITWCGRFCPKKTGKNGKAGKSKMAF